MNLVFDIETNGLLNELTRLHCLVLRDADSGDLIGSYTNSAPKDDDRHYLPLEAGLRAMEEADTLIGHNVLKFDIPALQKLYPKFRPTAKIIDTLVCTRLVWSDLAEHDFKPAKAGRFPSRLIGAHSLEAWGYRLGVLKGDFAKVNGKKDDTVWLLWTHDMQSYCEQDTEVTFRLWKRIQKKQYSQRAIELEHRFAAIIALQERWGFAFDKEKAHALYAKLVARRAELTTDLQKAFPPRTIETVFTPKVNNKAKGYVKGKPFVKRTVQVFNPSSRKMIADRLIELGWVPTEETPSGAPKIDDAVLSKLSFPEAKPLAEYFLVEKRIGQLAEGDQALLRLERDGRIHGTVITNGAVTGRCTHSRPNVAQTPRVGSPYGAEFRELYMTTSPLWVLVGADAAGLELRCLAHYMARYDGGAYIKVLLEGDVHWVNVQAMGLTDEDRDDSRKDHKLFRNGAKTFIYGFLYGAGDEKAGSIVYDIVLAMRAAGLDASRLVQKFFGGIENPDADDLAAAGSKLKREFLKKTPALKKLRDAVQQAVRERGYLIGLDGRILRVRSAHSALNTLLQSAGALIVKLATVIAYDDLSTLGYLWGVHWALVAHVHDELQSEAKKEIADEVGKTIVAAMRKAGEAFQFRCPIDGEYKVGRNWKETH